MKTKRVTNTLLFKIFCTVIAGVICLAATLCVVNISVSKKVFVDSFSLSQQKIFSQIDRQFYDFYSDMVEVINEVNTSGAVQGYLTGKDVSSIEEMQNIFNMKKQIEESRLSGYSNLSVVLVSTEGKSYVYNRSSRLVVRPEEILSNPITEKAGENPGKLICEYQEQGFTDVMKNSPCIIMARALYYDAKRTIAGYIYIMMKELDFKSMYSYFTSDTNDIIVMNGDREVISSNNKAYLEKDSAAQKEAVALASDMQSENVYQKEIKRSGEQQRAMCQRLHNTNYTLLGIINPEAAFAKQYDMLQIAFLTLAISAAILMLIFIFVRQQTRPLARLVNTMHQVRGGSLNEHAEVSDGTEEIRVLTETYNEMMRSINDYIERLMAVEQEKRTAEIHALQMQINPHYIYNTLASVKWLIWQGNSKLSTEVIDAFISLLRNTISNTQEFITVEQEISNLKNYSLINQARYGDAIQVEYYVPYSCRAYLVPKLILQPFVENAFFHAFPEGRKGKIEIFVKERDGYIYFDVADDGIGMNKERLSGIWKKEPAKKAEHFTGIGINNVDDRIKLIYGMDYGINITSEEGRGTKVAIFFPARKGTEA